MRIDSLNYLPQFILDNPDMKELLNAEQEELDLFFDFIELMRNQTSINTSSIYLSRYEKIFGLNVSPAISDSERIGRLLAKMNTRTNSTVEAIKAVVTSITGCETDIDEFYSQYKFMIHVLRDNDKTINIEDIKDLVEIVKPAHLAFGILMCWKWSIGLKVNTTVYKVAYDICADGSGDYDYCGETPNISYLGKMNDIKVDVSSKEDGFKYPYQFVGQYPIISTLGTNHDENGQIEVEVENYATPLCFAQEDGDYCGED